MHSPSPPPQCEFPGLGCMFTNRSGRFEFVFDPLFMEFFEREQYTNVREVGAPLRGQRARQASHPHP